VSAGATRQDIAIIVRFHVAQGGFDVGNEAAFFLFLSSMPSKRKTLAKEKTSLPIVSASRVHWGQLFSGP
jgi:hypothetical protein